MVLIWGLIIVLLTWFVLPLWNLDPFCVQLKLISLVSCFLWRDLFWSQLKIQYIVWWFFFLGNQTISIWKTSIRVLFALSSLFFISYHLPLDAVIYEFLHLRHQRNDNFSQEIIDYTALKWFFYVRMPYSLTQDFDKDENLAILVGFNGWTLNDSSCLGCPLVLKHIPDLKWNSYNYNPSLKTLEKLLASSTAPEGNLLLLLCSTTFFFFTRIRSEQNWSIAAIPEL